MSGKKKKKMAKKIRTQAKPGTYLGEKNEEKSLTMPDMQNDPRTVLENHVRGINPITGAVLDNARYYGNAVLPYAKDLTYEELRIKRQSLEAQALEFKTKMEAYEEQGKATDGNSSDTGLSGTEEMGEG